jgi:type IV pilus assembly protein PilZ
MDIKDDLKKIIREHLVNVASSFFIDKSLSNIDQSADSKESFLAAADRIRKRIALFIDKDLATKVFDILRLEIEKRSLSPGIRRRYLRVTLRSSVYVTYDGTLHELYTENVSEGGMFIKTEEPFPVGSEVAISVSLDAGCHLRLRGVVMSAKLPSVNLSGHLAGMGIEFKEVREDELRILRDFVTRTSAQDIPDGQKEAVAKPSLK